MALGQADNKCGKLYPKKARIEANIVGAEINLILRNGEKYLTEEMLYDLMFEMKTDKVKPFRKWVTSEVLPSIRKNGAYMTESAIEKSLNDPDFIIRLATNLKDEKLKRIEAESKIEFNKPKVIFADAVSVSHTSILVGDLAKILKQNGIDVGANRLFERLRTEGYLIRRVGSDYNMPTQKSMELKLFGIKETAITHSDGHITVSRTPKVTGIGSIYFVNKVAKNFVNKFKEIN